MSEMGLSQQEIINELLEERTTNYLFVAALTLVVYDGLLSISQEITSIWNRKLGSVTIVYLIIRYMTIADMFLQVFDGFYVLKTIPRSIHFSMPFFYKLMLYISCKAVQYLIYIAAVLSKTGYIAFDCLRIWGITQHQWLPTILVFALSSFDPAVNIYNYSIPRSYSIITNGSSFSCWNFPKFQQYTYLAVITRSVAVVASATALFFTLSATWHILGTNPEIKHQNSLTTTLIKNGSLQFGTALLLNLIVVILDIFSVANSAVTDSNINISTFVYIQQVLISIVLSHFILDLRTIYLKEHSTSQTNSNSTSLRFAANVQSNLGATLDTSWATAEARGIEEDEIILYSDNPFATGLLDSGRVGQTGRPEGNSGEIQEINLSGDRDDFVLQEMI